MPAAPVITETSGKSSVAELILQRHSMLHPDKPHIQLVDPKKIPIQDNSPVGRITTDVVLEEEKRKKLIFREAKENQEYYLLAAEENPEKKWFQFPKKDSQYSEFVMLTGPMAQACLDNIWQEEEGNRRLTDVDVQKYKRDIQTGAWIPTDEAIGVDYQGSTYNGRHRLTAISELWAEGIEIEVPFYFTFNVLTTARFVIDSGRSRPTNARLKLIINTSLGNRTGGFCKALMRGVNTNNKMKFSESEIALFASKWEHVIEWIAKNFPNGRAEVQAAIAKAYLWYGQEKIGPFCDRLREIKFSEEGDPAKALYLALTRQRINRINVAGVAYKKTLAAIHAVINGNQLQKLYEREEDIFQWNPGWELPEKPKE